MQESEKLFETVSDIWQSSIDRADFHAAILAGMSAYILLRAQGDDKLAQGALSLVHVAIEMWQQRTASKQSHEGSCSFCGLREPEVRLAAIHLQPVC